MSEKLEQALSALTPRERGAYRVYKESGKPAIAASTSASMFALFLQGHTCDDIAKLNPGFGLGAIVRARIEDDWDARRIEHTQELLDGIRQTVQRAQLGAMQFVADGLAAFQKLAGEKFQKYLQTGDVKDLGDFKDMNFKTYKELLELLLKLTGQDTSTKKVQGFVEHRHTLEQTQQNPGQNNSDRPMTAEEAHVFISALNKVGQ